MRKTLTLTLLALALVAGFYFYNKESAYSPTNNDNVYDLTAWINKHPGGRLAILAICGRDGSTAFNLKHGKSEKPNAKLITFKIGTVKK